MVIGIVGRGRWGKILEGLFRADPRVERVVVRGRSWEDLLDSRLSGVVVACAAAHHAEVARPFLEKGIPLFIEKPLALSREEAETLAEMAALRPRTPVLVDHLLLFSELYAPIRERVQRALTEGGSIDAVWITWTGDKRREDVSPLWDYGSHIVALGLDLFGPEISFVWVSGSGGDNVSGFSMEGGPLLRPARILTGAVVAPREPYRNVYVRLTDSAGSQALQWDDIRKTSTAGSVSISEQTPPLNIAVRTFLDAIEGKPDRRLGMDLGLKVVSRLAGLERAATRQG